MMLIRWGIIRASYWDQTLFSCFLEISSKFKEGVGVLSQTAPGRPAGASHTGIAQLFVGWMHTCSGFCRMASHCLSPGVCFPLKNWSCGSGTWMRLGTWLSWVWIP